MDGNIVCCARVDLAECLPFELGLIRRGGGLVEPRTENTSSRRNSKGTGLEETSKGRVRMKVGRCGLGGPFWIIVRKGFIFNMV